MPKMIMYLLRVLCLPGLDIWQALVMIQVLRSRHHVVSCHVHISLYDNWDILSDSSFGMPAKTPVTDKVCLDIKQFVHEDISLL